MSSSTLRMPRPSHGRDRTPGDRTQHLDYPCLADASVTLAFSLGRRTGVPWTCLTPTHGRYRHTPAVPYTTVTSQPCRRDRDHSQRTDSRVHRPERTSLASGLDVHGPWLSFRRPCATADSHAALLEPHVPKPPQGSDSPSVCALGHLHPKKNASVVADHH